jgi:cold shock CspA family protein
MRHTGEIVTVIGGKGYGFIRPDDENDDDVFVHTTKVRDSKVFTVGARVSFERRVDPAGRPYATDVQAAD